VWGGGDIENNLLQWVRIHYPISFFILKWTFVSLLGFTYSFKKTYFAMLMKMIRMAGCLI
jgi:hypothetical protein